MMPPRNSNWIIWWLILVPTALVIGKLMYEPTITLGEIIALGIAIPTVIVGIWRIARNRIYGKYPFRMCRQKELPWKKKRELIKHIIIPIGTSQIVLRIQPKRPTLFNKIHVCFVSNKDNKSAHPDKNIVKVVGLQAHAECLVGNIINILDDFTNGMEGNLENNYYCAPEESLFLRVTVSANKEWNGYIMFQSHRADEHRGYAFLPLRIKDGEVSL